MRRLLVMRHGKSDWSAGTPDHERPLDDRGRGAATDVGATLTAVGLAPDHVVSSTAVRARSTADRANDGGGWGLDVVPDRRLYESDVATTLDVLATSPDVGAVLLVGHQPTWSALVAHLSGGAVAMRTSTVAVLDLLVADWTDVHGAHAELLTVLQPRHLPPSPRGR